MKSSPSRKALLIAIVATLALPAAASAKYYVYRQGGATSAHTAAAYLNESHRKIMTLQTSGKCDDGSLASISAENVKVSSKHSFSGSADFTIYLYSTQTSYQAKAVFTGSVKKRKYVKVNFNVTTDAPGCAGLSHSFKAKFKGTQSGG